MRVAIASAVVGLIFGLLGGKVWILIPWGITSLFIGYFSKIRGQSLVNGAIFGFLASFFFMVSGYEGALPLLTRLPYFALIGLFGALCGSIISFGGFIIYKGVKKK